jgi:hypothetical protein
MDSYLQNLIEAGIKKGLKKKKKTKEQDVEEIVDYDGSIMGSKIPLDVNVANTTSQKTTDDVVDATRQLPSVKNGGDVRIRYWGESDMTATLGYEDTLGKDLSYEEAKKYFMDDLGFDEVEAEERLKALGYVKKAEDKVRLIENPALLEQLVDAAINRTKKEINPIILRQLAALRETLRANNLTIDDIIPYLNATE